MRKNNTTDERDPGDEDDGTRAYMAPEQLSGATLTAIERDEAPNPLDVISNVLQRDQYRRGRR